VPPKASPIANPTIAPFILSNTTTSLISFIHQYKF
jgi:hypothetical protein